MDWNKINKENPFQVPEGYFEEKRKELHNIPEQTASIKILNQNSTKWYYWAAAATFIGIVFWNTWNFKTDKCETLACIDKTELLQAVENFETATLLDYVAADTTKNDDLIIDLDDIDETMLLDNL